MFRVPSPVVGSTTGGLGSGDAGETVGTIGVGATVTITGSVISSVATVGISAGETTVTIGGAAGGAAATATGITVGVFIAVVVSIAAAGDGEGEFTDELPPMMCFFTMVAVSQPGCLLF